MAIGGGLDKKKRILAGIYGSSLGISMAALTIVAALEVFMLAYSVVNAPLYGAYLWHYRVFYLVLLVAAVVYVALSAFAKRDIDRRFAVFNVINPLYAVLFFAWALVITYFDAKIWGTVDTMIFMTSSLAVPLSFFLFPFVYAAIVIVADVSMLYLAVTVAGSAAPLINLAFFCVFQVVLGFCFLRMRVRLAERIVVEEDNADIDILTGFSNRREYDEDMKELLEGPAQDNLVYASIDLNGLKEVNDCYGHEAGDELLVGAAQCMKESFGGKGKIYRIGGDEFVALILAGQEELEALFDSYDESTQAWSMRDGIALSTSYGYARQSEFPGDSVADLARIADERMYASKARYYQTSGRGRRGRLAETSAPDYPARGFAVGGVGA